MIRLPSNPIRTWVRPAWFLPLMLAGYVATEAPYVWLVLWKQVALGPEILRPRDAFLLIWCAAFGALRALSLHPLAWPPYGQWLARTPWQLPKPLPLGPLHLTPRDGVLLGLVMLSMHDAHVSLLRVPLIFLFVYLVALCWTLAFTGCKAYAYAIAFGLGLAGRFWFDPITSLALAVLVYGLGHVGRRQSLRGFPWSKPWLTSSAEPPLSGTAIEKRLLQMQVKLGWPFDYMPRQASAGISVLDGTLVSLLAGWWLYCVLGNPIGPEARHFIFGLVTFGAFAAIGIRLHLYCQNYRSPINFWGRLLTLRWIVPGYDKVFVTPIAAVILCTLSFGLPGAWLPDIQTSGPCVVSLIAFVLLVGGPTLEEWRHTGRHRIVPTSNAKLLVKL
jgi:hypothetical protein